MSKELIVGIIVLIILLVDLLFTIKTSKKNNDVNAEKIEKINENLNSLSGMIQSVQQSNADQMNSLRREVNDALRDSRTEQNQQQQTLSKQLQDSLDKLNESQTKALAELREKLNESTNTQKESFAEFRDSILEAFEKNSKDQKEILDGFKKELHDSTIVQKDSYSKMLVSIHESFEKNAKTQTDQLTGMQKNMTDSLLKTQETVSKTLTDLQSSNEKKLEEIRGVVNEKLDKTLNDSLSNNFKQVSESLKNLYESLGKLQNLSSGVESLNKTLTNVKTKGTWGEVQLGRILEQTLTEGQYKKNVITKENSKDRVEYAICLPSDEKDTPIYLPIDSKFPMELYNKVIDASQSGDQALVDNACKDLKLRIKNEAKSISDKYVDPPHTTDYAIMFLPTESLYAEVMRNDDIVEECQKRKVVIAGPTTLTALLNTIAIGFRNAALNRETAEVKRLMEAIKGQVDSLDEAVTKARKTIESAAQATSKISERTRIMRDKMHSIGALNLGESDKVLGLTTGDSSESDNN